MPKLIDTHQHLMYSDVAGYSWADEIPALAEKSFLLERYAELTKGADIAGTIFMETGVDDADYKAEARHVAGLANQKNSGILGLIASCRPEDEVGFSDWLDECQDLGVVGYRRILHVMPDIALFGPIAADVRQSIGQLRRLLTLQWALSCLPLQLKNSWRTLMQKPCR